MSNATKNKRRFIRFNFPYTINIYPSRKKMISTYTENISEGGVNVVIKEKINPASIVRLQIYLKNAPLILKGKVVWVKEKENTLLEDEAVIYFNTGIEFQQLKKEEKKIIKNCVKRTKHAKAQSPH
ncbi:MAG: PilZ domain-containing protein [Candidatus Omnitrophota bacterium]|nr:MAG: PilZ domain-containing protein [Candidatus Omnitrophota bacterium]